MKGRLACFEMHLWKVGVVLADLDTASQAPLLLTSFVGSSCGASSVLPLLGACTDGT